MPPRPHGHPRLPAALASTLARTLRLGCTLVATAQVLFDRAALLLVDLAAPVPTDSAPPSPLNPQSMGPGGNDEGSLNADGGAEVVAEWPAEDLRDVAGWN